MSEYVNVECVKKTAQKDCRYCSRLEDKSANICRTTVVDDQWRSNNLRIDLESDSDIETLLFGKKANVARSFTQFVSI